MIKNKENIIYNKKIVHVHSLIYMQQSWLQCFHWPYIRKGISLILKEY